MNSKEIDKILGRNNSTHKFYLGCFPSDKIPISPIFPHCMVVNTDTSANVGEHWTAIFVESRQRVEYYDSLAFWPPVDKIAKFLHRFTHIQHNTTPLQSELSSACGKHAIYFLIKRCKRVEPFNKIIGRLRENKTDPDRLVNAYVRRIMDESV